MRASLPYTELVGNIQRVNAESGFVRELWRTLSPPDFLYLSVFDELNTASATRATCSSAFLSDLSLAIARIP